MAITTQAEYNQAVSRIESKYLDERSTLLDRLQELREERDEAWNTLRQEGIDANLEYI